MSASPLTAIRLGNFKAFGPTQRIPLKPLTLIFGPNSAGKSSLIHSLALVHEAGRSGNLDALRTDIGGTSIDLGGFRQYVFRHDAARRVDWSAEIDVAKLTGRLAELLAPVGTASVAITFGLPLDDLGTPVQDKSPSLSTYDVLGDGEILLRMSQRRDGRLRLDRLATEHPVFRQVFKAIVETGTTTSEIKAEDQPALDETIADLVPQLSVKPGSFLPQGIESVFEAADSGAAEAMLFPVSRGARSQDLRTAVRFYLPRILHELIRGLDEVIGGQIDRLKYLGPLRSYPPRHLAFSEQDDSNWHAGGGYAWDVLRRDETVRTCVNKWLGSAWLQTPYEIVLRELVSRYDIETQLSEPISDELIKAVVELAGRQAQDEGSENWQSIDMLLHEVASDPETYKAEGSDRDYLRQLISGVVDPDELALRYASQLVRTRQTALNELLLVDKRTETPVSHRDVGIGVSQVLPVLVACYGLQDKIIAIEQPEIHLHPALQAELADVFLQSALGKQGNRLLLESHSEHLMLRVLRRIRETSEEALPDGAVPVRPKDVAVLYIEPTPKGGQVLEIPVTEDGEFERPWPQGFFAERAKELF